MKKQLFVLPNVAICGLLRVSRLTLGFLAAARGAIWGKLKIYAGNKQIYGGCIEDHRYNLDAHSIPNHDLNALKWKIHPSIKYILIIEKDAAFDQLTHSKFCKENLILITGRGYPPLFSRKMIHNLHQNHPQIPIFCLVDCDAHGLDIFLSFQQGTINAPESYLYSIPDLLYLGVEFEDIQNPKLKINREQILAPNKKDNDKLKALRPFLKRKEQQYFDRYPEKKETAEYTVFKRIRKNLQIQSKRRKKVEIESLNNISLGDEYLPFKIKQMSKIYKLDQNQSRISPSSLIMHSSLMIQDQTQNQSYFQFPSTSSLQSIISNNSDYSKPSSLSQHSSNSNFNHRPKCNKYSRQRPLIQQFSPSNINHNQRKQNMNCSSSDSNISTTHRKFNNNHNHIIMPKSYSNVQSIRNRNGNRNRNYTEHWSQSQSNDKVQRWPMSQDHHDIDTIDLTQAESDCDIDIEM